VSRSDWIYVGYLVTIVSFIIALQFLSHPARARYGTWVGAFGMIVALVATFFTPGLTNFASIAIVMAISAPIGAYAARAVKMTAMPEMVALFNGVGGGAAALSRPASVAGRPVLLDGAHPVSSGVGAAEWCAPAGTGRGGPGVRRRHGRTRRAAGPEET